MTTNQRFDKSKLPSRHVTEGPSRAPHRSYFYAMGITEEEIHQPWVGVATCWNEAAPCNISLNRQAQSVKMGVKKGGGTPREFTTITVTDGIAMGHEVNKLSLAAPENWVQKKGAKRRCLSKANWLGGSDCSALGKSDADGAVS